MITRGSTPTVQFSIFDNENQPFDHTLISQIIFTFAQNGIKVEKRLQKEEITSNQFDIFLTQEETLSFSSNTFVEMQAEMKLTSGEVILTDIVKRSVKRTLNEVIFE